MSDKKIILLSWGNPNKIGGIETYNRYLSNFAKNNSYSNFNLQYIFDVSFYKIVEDVAAQPITNVILKKTYPGIFKKIQIFWKTQKSYRKINIKNSKIYIPDPHLLYFIPKKTLLLNEIIWVQHNSPKFVMKRFKTIFLDRIFHSKIKLIDKVICLTKENMDILKKEKFLKDKVFEYIVPNYLILDSIPSPKNYLSKSNEIIFIGRIHKLQKNLKLLSEIIKNANKKTIIIGGGPHEHMIDEVIHLENVSFLKTLPPSEVQKNLRDSKLLLLSSSEEGFPTVFWEAIRNYIPIVSTFSTPSITYFKDNELLFEYETCQECLLILEKILRWTSEEWKDFYEKVDKFISLSKNNPFTEKWDQEFKS